MAARASAVTVAKSLPASAAFAASERVTVVAELSAPVVPDAVAVGWWADFCALAMIWA